MISNFMQHLQRQEARPLTLICGMLTTKDPAGYFDHLKGLISQVITVPITSSDAGFDAQDLAASATGAGLAAKPAASLEAALGMLDAAQEQRILIAGSLYLGNPFSLAASAQFASAP